MRLDEALKISKAYGNSAVRLGGIVWHISDVGSGFNIKLYTYTSRGEYVELPESAYASDEFDFLMEIPNESALVADCDVEGTWSYTTGVDMSSGDISQLLEYYASIEFED